MVQLVVKMQRTTCERDVHLKVGLYYMQAIYSLALYPWGIKTDMRCGLKDNGMCRYWELLKNIEQME